MPFQADTRTPAGRVIKTKQVVHVADLTAEQVYLERDPIAIAAVELGGVRSLLVVPMLKEQELIGTFNIYRQEVRPFTEKQIELVQEFRRAGRHRHREHAAAQRAAPAHRRSHRGAGAADRDLGGAAGHLQFARRAGAGVRGHAGERDAHLRGQVRHSVPVAMATLSARGAMHNAPPALIEACASRTAIRPAPDYRPWPCRPDQADGSCCRYAGGAGLRRCAAAAIAPQSQSCRRANCGCGADAQGGRADRRHSSSTARRCAHSPTNRSNWSELRRPGRHRHREHAAAQRTAPAHRRSHRGAGAADRDLGGAEGHLQFAGRA